MKTDELIDMLANHAPPVDRQIVARPFGKALVIGLVLALLLLLTVLRYSPRTIRPSREQPRCLWAKTGRLPGQSRPPPAAFGWETHPRLPPRNQGDRPVWENGLGGPPLPQLARVK